MLLCECQAAPVLHSHPSPVVTHSTAYSANSYSFGYDLSRWREWRPARPDEIEAWRAQIA
jgi:hypothetical protein